MSSDASVLQQLLGVVCVYVGGGGVEGLIGRSGSDSGSGMVEV